MINRLVFVSLACCDCLRPFATVADPLRLSPTRCDVLKIRLYNCFVVASLIPSSLFSTEVIWFEKSELGRFSCFVFRVISSTAAGTCRACPNMSNDIHSMSCIVMLIFGFSKLSLTSLVSWLKTDQHSSKYLVLDTSFAL